MNYFTPAVRGSLEGNRPRSGAGVFRKEPGTALPGDGRPATGSAPQEMGPTGILKGAFQ
jgi:hypothetical protein